MKAFIRHLGVFVLLIATRHPSYAQSPNSDEEAVRNAYAKLSFLCELPPLTEAAFRQVQKQPVDTVDVEKRMAEARPAFEISEIKSGSIASIADEPWGNFVTLPSSGSQVLTISPATHGYNNFGRSLVWQEANAEWIKTQRRNENDAHTIMSRSVGDIIKMSSQQWTKDPVDYKSYVALSISASLLGRSTGPYKAMFLVGLDSRGKRTVIPNDLVGAASQALFDVLNGKSAYPSELFQSDMRDTPLIAEWLRKNVSSGTTSTSMENPDLLCVRGKCSIPSVDVNRDLAKPLAHVGVTR